MIDPQIVQRVREYVEPSDVEWTQRFHWPAVKRKDRLDNEKLTIAKLIELHEDQILDLFTWYVGLPPELQRRCARQLREGLDKVRAARERNEERALDMLADRWVNGQ